MKRVYVETNRSIQNGRASLGHFKTDGDLIVSTSINSLVRNKLEGIQDIQDGTNPSIIDFYSALLHFIALHSVSLTFFFAVSHDSMSLVSISNAVAIVHRESAS